MRRSPGSPSSGIGQSGVLDTQDGVGNLGGVTETGLRREGEVPTRCRSGVGEDVSMEEREKKGLERQQGSCWSE